MLLAVGMFACTNGGEHDSPAADPTSSAGAGDIESAFQFAVCMRDNGIPDFADPQIRADGDYFLEPPTGVGDAELTTAETACQHILGPPAQGPAASTAVAPAGWKQIVPGGDCQCSDGSAFSFWVREADPDKVVFYLQDGGACFSAETCEPEQWSVRDNDRRRCTAGERNLRLQRRPQSVRRLLRRLRPLLHR